MIVAIWIVIASVVLVGSAFVAFQQGGEENLFAGGMAVAGVVVMLVTLLIYPTTRARRSE